MATVAAAINELTSRFAAAGLDSPRLDARILVGHASGLEPSLLFARSEHLLSCAESEAVKSFADRRLKHEPVSRILGRREFWGLDFELNTATLDPRPDTESLVSAALALRDKLPSRSRILDLGTGTGCILIAILTEWPESHGLGVDLDSRAVAAAEANARRLGVGGRAQFRVGDWCKGLTEDFDLIVSNPPYIGESEARSLSPEVALFDPPGALFAGLDGLSAYEALIPQARDRLSGGGRLILEIGATQEKAVESCLKHAGMAIEARVPDLSGRVRALIAHHG